MENNKKKTLAIVLTVFAITIVLGSTYAFITQVLTGNKQVIVNAGVLDLVLEEENEITISDALPMYDEVGMIQEDVFKFRLINKTSNPTDYVLKIQDVETGTLAKSDVKYGLIKNGETSISLLSNLTDGIIDKGTIEGNQTNNYELRLWIKDSVTEISQVQNKFLRLRMSADATQKVVSNNGCKEYEEKEPNAPQLTSGMIPVTYNETDKTWVKADTSNSNWYDYDNQIWANAVTVTKETRQSYMNAAPNTPILMKDINTMWVWIPRYSYTIMQPAGRSDTKCSDLGEITLSSPASCRKTEYPTELRSQALAVCQGIEQQTTGTNTVVSEDTCVSYAKNVGLAVSNYEDIIDYGIIEGYLPDTRVLVETYPDNYTTASPSMPGAIDIRFISTGEKDRGTGKCENCADNWVTPDGFTFGNEEIPGFWIGKFETSTLESCIANYNSINTDCDLTTLTPQIKPNVTSWRGARVSTFFEASRLMQSSDNALNYNANTYGFDAVGTSSMDSHMLKNTEWGIVAILSQSKYGKYGNSNYVGANKEVYQNKSSSYITGSSNGTPSTSTTNTQVTYDTENTGYGASTTGTIYGVYDMSGGANEYVMGNYNNISGTSTSYNSGFCGTNGPTEGCREWPNAKYFDLYTSDTASTGYKFGDAVNETFNWYGDGVDFVSSNYPWFLRGGDSIYNTNPGVFNSSKNRGESYAYYASRFVIKP